MTRCTRECAQRGESRKILWIRVNPDGYEVDGKKVTTNHAVRMEKLVALINNHVPTSDFEIIYLYYDMANGAPVICSDTLGTRPKRGSSSTSRNAWLACGALPSSRGPIALSNKSSLVPN